MTLQGMCHLSLKVRRCQNEDCSLYHRPYRPEEEGRWALPHGEFGLDVIALVGRCVIPLTGACLKSIRLSVTEEFLSPNGP